MRIVLMGPPGAGKGTQAKRLAERFDMVHLSSGDILRAKRGEEGALGAELRKYMDAGALVPDEIVVRIMAEAIASQPDGKGLLLDGFPRTVAQARALDEQLGRLGRALDLVLVIDVPDGLLLERITGRRSCPACGKVFHTKYLPPAADNRCDACGAELVQRDDDTEQVVRQRLEAYRRETAPVIEYYRQDDHREVVTIDGSATPDEVTARAAEALREHASET